MEDITTWRLDFNTIVHLCAPCNKFFDIKQTRLLSMLHYLMFGLMLSKHSNYLSMIFLYFYIKASQP